MTSWFAQLSPIGWWPVRVVLVVPVVVLVVGAANVLAGVNAYYGYHLTLGQAIGVPGGDMASLAQLNRRTVPADGLVVAIDIPNRASRFPARPAEVYVLPAWFARPRPRLPVLVLLHGTPGGPLSWVDGGKMAQTLDTWATKHGGRTPIVVMARHQRIAAR